jgi:regulator of RNase E activity RraA
MGSSAIDTARRSWSIAGNFSAWLLQRKALPSPRYKRIIVIDTRGSRAALSGNVPFVIEVT